MKRIKVLIADDHSVVRTGLSAILSFEKDIRVVGMAANGDEAVRLATGLRPDVVIMDLMMPVANGVSATTRLASAAPDAKVLVLTSLGSAEDIRRALDAGARGAITKGASDDALIAAIRKVASGEVCISPEIRGVLNAATPAAKLTPHQLEILESVTRGLSNDDIAKQHGIAPSTVKHLLTTIFSKLGASTRAEAVAIALRDQLLKI